jgi:arylsulfatase A-like enzyme
MNLIKRRNGQLILFILISLGLGMEGCAPKQDFPDTANMNILFINVEDLASTAVGSYGNSMVQTPHIDRLAHEGVRFTRAYAQGSMCNPSRSSFCTGMRPASTGVLTNQEALNEVLPSDATSIAEILQQKNAWLGHLGKLYHFVPPAQKQMSAFDELGFCVEPEGYQGTFRFEEDTSCANRRFHYSKDERIDKALIERHKQMKEVEKDIPHGAKGWWEKGGKSFYLLYFELIGDSGEPEECMEDGQKARAAAEIIKEKAAQNQQFFLSVGFDKPHTPTIAPKKYVDLYPPEEMQLTDVTSEKDVNIPSVAKRFGEKPDIFMPVNQREFPQLAQTEKREKEMLSAYYASATYIDAQIGILLNTLEEAGIAENTIVIFFSDHGFHLGEHGLWSKYSLFEEVIRVPLIVKIPGMPTRGLESDGLVELVDLLPTLCDLWGIPLHKTFEGISMKALLQNPRREWKKAAFSHSGLFKYDAKSVVGERYKYNSWQKDTVLVEELYDLQNDPYEQHNLAPEAGAKPILEDMRQTKEEGWQASLPVL